MTDWLEDKAESGPDVVTTGQSAYSAWRLKSLDRVDADEISPEGEFPKFGDFMEMERPDTDSTAYLEICADLAAWLVENDAEPGMEFRIKSVEKTDGEWEISAERLANE